jgi:hypothetical protein
MTAHQHTPLVDSSPLRVAVCGRPFVGTSTVAAALTAAGRFDITDIKPDLTVRVVAETVKPEDQRAIAGMTGQVLILLTKADTCGLGPGGPVQTARRRSAELSALAGAPAEPVVGLLALAALDNSVLDAGLLHAVKVLVSEPADLRTAETFVTAPHSLTRADRHRLLDRLDLFGIAHAVVLLRHEPDASPQDVRDALRRVSGIDEVLARIEVLGAESRYRRLQTVVAELEVAAIDDAAVAELLASDEVLEARMTAAMRVMRAAGTGAEVRTGGNAGEHLARARHWRRYGAGPVSTIHRACAADIARGSLRMWGATR